MSMLSQAASSWPSLDLFRSHVPWTLLFILLGHDRRPMRLCHASKHATIMSLLTVIGKFWQEYTKSTPKKLKIIDAYLLYIFLTGVIQFVYCCLVGTFPFNSFLSGFISCVSCFILAVCLRLQVNPQNRTQFHGISPERGFADFIFAHVILHIVVMNFIG